MTDFVLTDEDREAMRYDPAVDRQFKPENGKPCLHLGHECNTPLYVLDGLAQAACHDKPANWSAKVSWRFPFLDVKDRIDRDQDWVDRLAVRPRFVHIANQDDMDRWFHTDQLDLEPFPFDEPHWVWETEFKFAIERRHGSHGSGRLLAGGIMRSGCFACITLTRYNPDNADQTLVAIAEVIEALNADAKSVVARECDWCCFCGPHLVEPRSRVVGYGPDCAKRYNLPY
jgi:hypothetical protein